MIALDLRDRVAVVTGASAGIGQATVGVLVEAGATVLAVARREENLRELAETLPSGAVIPLPLDITEPDAAAGVVDAVEAAGGRLDILVNAAGGSRTVAVDAPDSAWDEAMELNFSGGRRLSQALIPFLRRSEHGRIITVTGSSEPATNPVFADASRASALNASNSAKAAAHAWSKGLSRELGVDGITVNCVAPGTILTEQLARIFPTEEDRRRHVEEMGIPAGRFGAPIELAHTIAFLASDLAEYITGEIISVDGGKRRFAF